MNLHVIETDGAFFLSQLKIHTTANRCIASDQMYEDVGDVYDLVGEAHKWLHDNYNAVKHPQILFCSWYQDGMMHAIERMLRLKKTGQYSDLHRVTHSCKSYFTYAERYKKLRRFNEAAYCYGYSNAYLYAALTNEERQKYLPPLFFYFGAEIQNAGQYRRALRHLPDLHKTAFKYAQGIARKNPYLANHILHHIDQLDLSLVRD